MTSDTRPGRAPQHGRRSLLRTAAWATPTVAIASQSPALAASPRCQPVTYNWNSVAAGTSPGTITLIPAAGSQPALTATIAITAVTGTQSGSSGTVVQGPQGAVTGNYYRMEFAPVAANNTMTVTISFNRPVVGTSFSLLDIDATMAYRDSVEVLTTPFTGTRASQVTGTGTAADPYRMTTPYANIPPTSANGNLGLSFTRSSASLSSVSFRYFNDTSTGSQNMVIGLGNITVTPC